MINDLIDNNSSEIITSIVTLIVALILRILEKRKLNRTNKD